MVSELETGLIPPQKDPFLLPKPNSLVVAFSGGSESSNRGNWILRLTVL